MEKQKTSQITTTYRVPLVEALSVLGVPPPPAGARISVHNTWDGSLEVSYTETLFQESQPPDDPT
jgi:hypothetical protein